MEKQSQHWNQLSKKQKFCYKNPSELKMIMYNFYESYKNHILFLKIIFRSYIVHKKALQDHSKKC